MARLREETREHHARAEGSPLERALVSGRISRAGYAAYLGQRLLVHRALEHAMRVLAASRAVVAELVPDELFQERNLLNDLRVLAIEPGSITPARATQRLVEWIEQLGRENALAVLGAYYVFEGSKNGGRFIARAMRQALTPEASGAVRYLDPHGEAQPALWAEFKRKMDALGFETPAQDALVAAAQTTFEHISQIDDELWAAEQRRS